MTSDPILITGVGKRVGLHIAHTFLKRNIPVIGTYRTHYKSLDELKIAGAELIPCDFEKREDTKSLILTIKNKHKSLRGVIHNASDWLSDDTNIPTHQIIEKMMNIHATIPYEINLQLSDLLMNCKQPHADIIHIGDYVSSKGSKKHIAYAASKAAQDNLTLSFAKKLAPKVKVNSIAPALLLFNKTDGDVYRTKSLSKSLMEREGGLDEIQNSIDHLLNSGYITGRIMPLDGGRHLR